MLCKDDNWQWEMEMTICIGLTCTTSWLLSSLALQCCHVHLSSDFMQELILSASMGIEVCIISAYLRDCDKACSQSNWPRDVSFCSPSPSFWLSLGLWCTIQIRTDIHFQLQHSPSLRKREKRPKKRNERRKLEAWLKELADQDKSELSVLVGRLVVHWLQVLYNHCFLVTVMIILLWHRTPKFKASLHA